MLPSERDLVFLAVALAIFGCFIAVSQLDGVFLSTKLAFAPYVPVIVPGIFLYLYVSKRLLAQFSRFFSWSFFFTLVWWVLGCGVGYGVALLGSFGLMYFATRFEYLSWISIGPTLHSICTTSLVLTSMVCAVLIVFHIVKRNINGGT